MSKLKKLVSRGAGEIDPTSVEAYAGIGGFSHLGKALDMTPLEIIDEVKKAVILGRGGAAYPAGRKWEQLYNIKGSPKYIVCNADEGEPGTFKDKLILDKLPLKLIEGITIAGYVFGAEAGFIYVRGEYRKIQRKINEALENARKAGYLGKAIMGRQGFDFDIHIITGAGAYVCGENSALLNSTEGKVGRPRIKPPHLAEVGLFLKPTLVNNVETLASIPDIIELGGDEYLKVGHPQSGGTKLVCLSGHAANKGTYEIPLDGVTLRDIIYDPELGGGLADGKKLKFYHLGGQSGCIGAADQLDTVYSYTDLKKAGLSVGSGAVVVMNEDVSIIEYLKGVAEFFIHESCGKCVPCRSGNKQILRILNRLGTPGMATQEDLDALRRLSDALGNAACGLGRTVTAALESAWKLFPEEFEANVRRCDAEAPKRACQGGVI